MLFIEAQAEHETFIGNLRPSEARGEPPLGRSSRRGPIDLGMTSWASGVERPVALRAKLPKKSERSRE